MKDIFHDPEQMMMMDYADEADRKGLDIWEFSTLEELLDALRDADHDALFSASCDDDDDDDYDYYDVDKDDDDDDNDDDVDEDDDGDYNVDDYDVDEDEEDEDDDDEVDSFYFDHVIASLSKPDLTAHTSLSSQPSPASQAAQTSQPAQESQSVQTSQSTQAAQSGQVSQSAQAAQSVQASRGSQELPAPSRPVREPRRPEMPEPSSFIVFFFLYLVIMAMLILGSLHGLISYGRAESWKDWAVEIAAIIGLFVIPILLYVLNHKINMNDYKKNMEKYEAEMKVYEKRLEAYEKFTRGETVGKGDFDKASGPSQAQQDAQMKKALILMGSPRKNGNTASLAKPFISTLSEAGFRCETVWLCDLDIRPCLACRACQADHTKAACAQQDDMTGLYDQVLACDLLILATPIYSWYCTPPMKAALDRLVYGLNKYYGSSKGPSLWAGKKVALIVTCGYPPEKGADLFAEGIRRYCRHSQLEYAGMLAERHLGYDTVFMDEEKAARAKAFAEEVAGTTAKEQPGGDGGPTR